MPVLKLIAALCLATVTSSVLAEDRAVRAIENYRRLSEGTIGLGDLSLQEKADLAELWRARRHLSEERHTKKACVDRELKREGGNPSRLARRIIELKCSEG